MTNVAQTILSQLGGNKFIAMTGSKDFVGSENNLTFKLARVINGVSHVSITLDVNDLYRVEFRKWNARRLDMTIVAVHSDVYADMLRPLFENETGLITSL